MKNISKLSLTQDEICYLDAYKNLYVAHQKYFGLKTSPHMPGSFIERLCIRLLKLKKIKGKAFDAVNISNTKKYEIKGTSAPNTKTTFSNSIPDYIIWVYTDIPNKKIKIYKEDCQQILRNCSSIGHNNCIDLIKFIQRCIVEIQL